MQYSQEFLAETVNNRTESLFKETMTWSAKGHGIEPIYTIKDYDMDGLFSAKRIYLECRDPTEYSAAIALVGNWQHWQRIRANKKLGAIIDEWAEELEVKLRSEGLQDMAKHSKKSTDAAKWLSEGRWKGRGVGRPSKEEVERETRIAANIEEDIQDILKRVSH